MPRNSTPRTYPSQGLAENRVIVLVRDAGHCRYCGAPATCVDHILSQAKGGTDDLENMVASCRRCNARASDRLFLSFEEKRRVVTTELATLKRLGAA
jgi:5-methylcytosine-specific restriction endonuclease McrA